MRSFNNLPLFHLISGRNSTNPAIWLVPGAGGIFSSRPTQRAEFVELVSGERIGHVRYINIRGWLRGFRVKIAKFSSFLCPSIPKRDLDTKKTTPNIEVWPESLRAMLEYWYIERGLLALIVNISPFLHFHRRLINASLSLFTFRWQGKLPQVNSFN